MPVSDPKIIVALDSSGFKQALKLANQLDPQACRLKVGKELFTAAGPSVVRELHGLGFEIFLDLKFHDIPNTTAKACAVAAELGVWMVNVHASGGRAMMERCVEELNDFGADRPRLVGVTVLTSLNEVELKEVGVSRSPNEQVLLLAQLAQSSGLDGVVCSAREAQHSRSPNEQVLLLAQLAQTSGLDGVVCSAREAQQLRQHLDDSFLLVTPGIRPKTSDANDQKRIATPSEALESGVDYLVIGRPITQAENPRLALLDINNEIRLAGH